MSGAPIALGLAERWRLLLGEASGTALGGDADEATAGTVGAMDRALAWLYGREQTGAGDPLDRHGGSEASRLSVPEWIDQIHTLFPKETIERLERDAIERYGIDEIVTNLDVLQRATPNAALLEAVLRSKHLMNPQVLAMARELVAQVVQALIEKLSTQVQRAFSGTRRRQQLVRRGSVSEFAPRETLKRNLRHFDAQRGRLVIERPMFHPRHQRSLEPWQVILLVDQSGSMVSSVIHAAVTAACLWRLPGIRTHLVAFDTAVVDLTDSVGDPVELLMGVQLGGGTSIGHAVGYAADLIDVPRRAIVVVISDFYDGLPEHVLIGHVKALVGQGSRVLGLAALDEKADPAYDRALAQKLVEAGAQVGAMTPGQLANWLASVLG